MNVELLASEFFDEAAVGLVALLADSIEDGNSVGFVQPVDTAELIAFWHAALRTSGTLTWVARDAAGMIGGCVQLKPVAYPNGQHRADVSKLLVLRDQRGRGIASRLMSELEAEARRQGRTLLMLDTQTGSPAEGIYERWGWQRYGVVPDYAAWPDGSLGATTFFYKVLASATS